jgi:uncharacterized LabA/DUF88 family protein
MFKPTKISIEEIAKKKCEIIKEIALLLQGRVNVYIDYANVRPWSERLGWHVDVERLKHFLDSFDNIKAIHFYYGILPSDSKSEELIEKIKKLKYQLRTKPVKIMHLSIDVSSIDMQSTALLKNFIRNDLLRKYEVETIEYLNRKFKEMNIKGVFQIEERKCNFDVEIGSDMVLALERNEADCFILWSGDSDFHDPIKELLDKGKRVIIFASARLVSSELNDLRKQGLMIFDIKKIKEFICWKRELRV